MNAVNPNQPPQAMNFRERFVQAAQDSKITRAEAQELKAHIAQMNTSAENKTVLTQLVDKLNEATTFNLFGIFEFKSPIDDTEKAGLQALARNNAMANQLLGFYNQAANQQSTLDPRLVNGPTGGNHPSAYSGRPAQPSHHMPPSGVNFPPGTPQGGPASPTGAPAPAGGPAAAAPVDNTPMGDMEQELFQAIMNYPGNKATEAEARQIARTMNQAGQALGFSADNMRKMLAVFAHESGGFNPRAVSPTGAGGLGQLTGVAIEDMNRLSRSGGPYAQHRDKLVAPGGNRSDISSNVWTSMAYMHHLMGQIGSQDISNAFVAYNTGVGGYRALMTMPAGQADAALERMTGVAGKGREARGYAQAVWNAMGRLFG